MSNESPYLASDTEERVDTPSTDGDGVESLDVSLKGLLLPLGLGISVVFLIAYFTWDEGALTKFINSVDPLIMGGAVLMLFLRVLFGGWRISFVSRHALGFMAGIRSQLAWDFASNISPSVVGGAPLTAYYIARESRLSSGKTIAIGDVSAVMTYIMLLDQVWFALSVPAILISAFYMDVIPPSVGIVGLWAAVTYFILLMAYAVVFAYATLFHPELLGRIAGRIFRLPLLRRFKHRVDGEMKEFEARAAVLRRQKSDFFLRGFLLTTGTWLARYSLVVFVIWSFVPDVDSLLLFMRSIAMTISALVMPTPGGAGGIEGLYVLFFRDLLPDKSLLVPSLLTWRILGYYVFLVMGISLSTRHIQKSKQN